MSEGKTNNTYSYAILYPLHTVYLLADAFQYVTKWNITTLTTTLGNHLKIRHLSTMMSSSDCGS